MLGQRIVGFYIKVLVPLDSIGFVVTTGRSEDSGFIIKSLSLRMRLYSILEDSGF